MIRRAPIAALVALVAFTRVLGAGPVQILPGAGATAPRSEAGVPTHAWFVRVDDRGEAVLEHVPPRRRAGSAGKLGGAADGVVRNAAVLDGVPRAIAATDARVFLLFDARAHDARGVYSLSARPTPLSDRWRYEPEGRLRVEPSLPAAGEVEGFAASRVGVGALLVERGAGSAGQRRLLLLEGGEWRRAMLPPEVESATGPRSHLFSTGEGLGIVRRLENGAIERWHAVRAEEPARVPISDDLLEDDPLGDLGRSAPAGARSVALKWTRDVLGIDGSAPPLDSNGLRVFESFGRMYLVRPGERGSLEVISIGASSSDVVATIPEVGNLTGVVWFDTPARVVAAWIERREVPGSKPPPGGTAAHIEVREVSLVDGRTEFSGPMKGDPPLSPREVQWLAVGLVMLMGAVLLVVLRADPGEESYIIPPGTSLATSGVRMTAGVIDLLTAGVVAARAMGIAITELSEPAFVMSERSLVFVGATVAAGLVLGVVGEALLGRSIGKLLTGCEVVDVRVTGSKSHPRVWQALVRNIVKWVLSPAALLGLMEPQGRHRGDALSRTAVVVDIPEDVEEEQEPD